MNRCQIHARRMNPLIRVCVTLVLAMACFSMNVRAQQGVNNLWMGGYVAAGIDTALGGVDIDFISGTRVISTVDRNMNFFRTSANITDEQGNLLFSTNGVRIANATGDTMLNGGGLNPSWYTSQQSQHPDGLLIPQACLILPKPDDPNIYYLFHGTLDDPLATTAHYLYLTTVNTTLDNGLGGVVVKNQVLIHDTLNIGRITAVRHANGRDWWVFCHEANSNIYHRLLVSPEGVSVDGEQAVGVVRPPDFGQVCFSPDGSRYAYYAKLGNFGHLDVFDFDRCTGLFSNAVHVQTADTLLGVGLAFSPNSRFLYTSAVLNVYQYDTDADDIGASMVHIAAWDSTYSPSPPFATAFDLAQLAPDGHVYFGTGSSTLRLM